jgi:hypothetical protein
VTEKSLLDTMNRMESECVPTPFGQNIALIVLSCQDKYVTERKPSVSGVCGSPGEKRGDGEITQRRRGAERKRRRASSWRAVVWAPCP